MVSFHTVPNKMKFENLNILKKTDCLKDKEESVTGRLQNHIYFLLNNIILYSILYN